MRIGIFFGGKSREREISFAGGRTVYDLLDKSLFQPVPLFIDSLGNIIRLEWSFLYKGTIRDFYPPNGFYPAESEQYQLYVENLLPLSPELQDGIIGSVGEKVRPEDLPGLIDFAFLALHGSYGEDGSVQGLLHYYDIPYSGSGILPSAIGISKAVQKRLMQRMGLRTAEAVYIPRDKWEKDSKAFFSKAKEEMSLPVVVKAATQGSSIGISVLHEWNEEAFVEQVNRAFFKARITKEEWTGKTEEEKVLFLRRFSDIYEGIGLPVKVKGETITRPDALQRYLDRHFEKGGEVLTFESLYTESGVLVERFIKGREFSCIVVENENDQPLALPPTEIVKRSEIFDYRAKYLPGISRKITPIDLPAEGVRAIAKACTELYKALEFNVYARIDGILSNEGEIFLNDPNTTSGMLPSSFFFHQAAEIGLSPGEFLTYIVHKSLENRSRDLSQTHGIRQVLQTLEDHLSERRQEAGEKKRIGVVLGGVSSERHISLESGRNVFEKINATGKYQVLPLFLTQQNGEMAFHLLPYNLLLKDNADDIREVLEGYKIAGVVEEIIEQARALTATFGRPDYNFYPEKYTLEELPTLIDFAFIALHGRPGEDGTLQKGLLEVGVPFNGSGPESSAITINKYVTNEILRENGLLIPKHILIEKADWKRKQDEILEEIREEIGYPLIAKPADDGCSSAVMKINNEEDLIRFAEGLMRDAADIDEDFRQYFKLKYNEEIPCKTFFVVEELVKANDAERFIEITGGLLTHYNDRGELEFQMFEPSEALAEGGILSLEEKFLAGEGQNITPARFSRDKEANANISAKVKAELQRAAQALQIEGYCRIDAFVRIFGQEKVEVVFIEANSLPGLTPATVIFHQAAIEGYKPSEFLEQIINFGLARHERTHKVQA